MALFAVGAPRVLSVQARPSRPECVATAAFCDGYLALVTSTCVQIWGGGQVRPRRQPTERVACLPYHTNPYRTDTVLFSLARVACLPLQHRVKLSEVLRPDESLTSDGVNVKAVWRPQGHALAVLVRLNTCACLRAVGHSPLMTNTPVVTV